MILGRANRQTGRTAKSSKPRGIKKSIERSHGISIILIPNKIARRTGRRNRIRASRKNVGRTREAK